MPDVFLVWVGGPISRATLRDHLGALGFRDADCVILGDHYAAKVTATPEDCAELLRLRHLHLDRRAVFVSDASPLPDEPRLRPESHCSFREVPDVAEYRFPAKVCVSDADSTILGEDGDTWPPLGPKAPSSAFKRRMTYSLYEKKLKPNVYKVCLTGGPCAGKTTTLSTVISKFNAQGIRTYAVPEVATTLINGGMSFTGMTREKVITYQSVILSMQLSLEQHFLDVALADEGPALIISDRGTMDGKAYCDEETWSTILTQLELSNVQLRDQQYDAVFHLVTAADGAEQYYGNQTNAIRHETPEQARELDRKTLGVYLGHPRLRIIDNSTDFGRKVERVLTSISEGMGVTLPTGVNRRYLVQPPVPTALPVPTVALDVEIGILHQPDPELEVRVVSRGQDGRFSYFLQELRDINSKPVITEKKLTPEEYFDRQRLLDEDLEIIRKKALSFTYNNQYFELCTIITPQAYSGTALLYIESNTNPDLPPFVPIEREVTDDPMYNTLVISQTDYNATDPAIATGSSMYSFISNISQDDVEDDAAHHPRDTRALSISLTANLINYSLKSFKLRPGAHRASLQVPGIRQESSRQQSVCSNDSNEPTEDVLL